MEKDLIKLTNIDKNYNEVKLYDNFCIDFEVGKVSCIMGKSGVGKSTLLKILSKIEKNDNDNFKLNNYKISYIFQEDRLIEWLNVEKNISLILESIHNKKEIEQICDKYLNMLNINQFKDYYPQMLSGGIRQRVNIARGLSYSSDILIMDEPFKSIDINNKKSIMKELKCILNKQQKTVLFVTHDVDEAIYFSDSIYILEGRPVKIKKRIKNNEGIQRDYIENLI